MSFSVVGLGHQAQQGKDAAASFLAPDYHRVAFADALKDMALEIMPGWKNLVEKSGWEWLKKNVHGSREVLQNLGVYMRGIDPDWWVNQAFKKIDAIYWTTGHPNFVITDVRFPNEFNRIRAQGGQLIKIWRPDVNPPNQHISEHALSDADWDATIVNDGTLEDLGARIRELVYGTEEQKVGK